MHMKNSTGYGEKYTISRATVEGFRVFITYLNVKFYTN